jgi:aerobic-type carbon monoxide dehydrogenase small subunit (CoxS/CutS family)
VAPEAARRIRIRLEVNGRPHDAEVEARRLLVHFVRDELGLTGTHIGCDTGSCGACTVILDGRAVKSCMLLAAQADDCSLRTVEGLTREDGSLSPIQSAFHDAHALQCGYCTPGMLMSATYLLERNAAPTDDEIRHAIQGNICRCTGYQNILRAVRTAAEQIRS